LPAGGTGAPADDGPAPLPSWFAWHCAINMAALGAVVGLLWLLPYLALALTQAEQLLQVQVREVLWMLAHRRPHPLGSDDATAAAASGAQPSTLIGRPQDMWKAFVGCILGQVAARVLSSRCCSGRCHCSRYRVEWCLQYSMVSVFVGLGSLLLSALLLVIVALGCHQYGSREPSELMLHALPAMARGGNDDPLTQLQHAQVGLGYLVDLFLAASAFLGLGVGWFVGSHFKVLVLQLRKLRVSSGVRACSIHRASDLVTLSR
jgi:hypothetical protein